MSVTTDRASLQQALFLYELSLAVGGSTDPHEVCQQFLNCLMQRKHLSFASVWIHPKLHLCPNEQDWRLYTAIPAARALQTRLSMSHPFVAHATAQQWTRACYGSSEFTDLTLESDVNSGTHVVFPLPLVGALKLYSNKSQGLSEPELQQLRAVVEKFGAALSGALAHRKLRHETSERERAEKHLHILGSALATATNGVLLLDIQQQNRISYVNPAFEAMLKLNAESVLGECFSQIINTDPVHMSSFCAAVTEGRPLRCEIKHFFDDGSYCDLEVSIEPVVVGSTAPAHAVVILDDITASNRLEKQLLQSQKMEALGQLAGGIAHDFNNLLGAVLGYSELLKLRLAMNSDKKLIEYVEQIITAGENGRDLIKQILSYVRLNQHESDNVIDIAAAVEEAVVMLRLFKPPTVELELSIAGNIPHIAFDTIKLQQILMNLFLNARDAMQDSGRIEIRLQSISVSTVECACCFKKLVGDYVELQVSDTGCGIDAKIRDRIFDPFFTSKTGGNGTGLGLSIVHTLLQANNAHVAVESETGTGTRFRLFFPAVEIQQSAPVPLAADIANQITHHGNILIAEDEQLLAEYFREFLVSNGYTVTLTDNGAQAWQLLEANQDRFDLLLTDKTMPRMGGLELAAKIRDRQLALPIVMSTGYSETVAESEVAALGLDALLFKPVNQDQLLKTIYDLLNR